MAKRLRLQPAAAYLSDDDLDESAPPPAPRRRAATGLASAAAAAPPPPPQPPPPPPPPPPPRRRQAAAGRAASSAAAAAPAAPAPTAFHWRVPPRATALQLCGALQPLAPSAGAPLRADGLSVLPPVPAAGLYAGHCAFAALLRSSGARLPPPDELSAIMALRGLAVAHLCLELLRDADFLALVAAAADDGAPPARAGRTRGATAPAPASAWPAVGGYLAAQLSRAPLLASQYAGPLELAAVAVRLARRVVVLVEADNKQDSGGLFGPASYPPLVIVNNRRRHMFPVLITSAQASALTSAHLRALAAAAIDELAQGLAAAGAQGLGGVGDERGGTLRGVLAHLRRVL